MSAPDDKPITISINGTDYQAPQREMTGAQIKALGNVPAAETLFKETGESGKENRIADDQTVKLHTKESFTSSPDGGVS